ncbi:uncharacterized protein BXZ73DRAFT_55866, partial [Epithele typhae]|uniref:uncharacterized protein n=1 Tax=Epithele typhae TaxID=378194 RepID=UPI0020080F84
PVNLPEIQYSINVQLPTNADGSYLNLNKLVSFMPHFVHSLGPLADGAVFGEVELYSGMSAVYVESLLADHVGVTAMDACIKGTFYAFGSLRLHTSGAPITARTHLFNLDVTEPTRLDMRTTDAEIHSEVSLLCGTPDEHHPSGPGAFSLSAHNRGGPVNLAVLDAPLSNHLRVHASAHDAPATVALPPSYEGGFEARTTYGPRPVVEWREELVDPAGLGRKRGARWGSVQRGRVAGRVGWGAAWSPWGEESETFGDEGNMVVVESWEDQATLIL